MSIVGTLLLSISTFSQPLLEQSFIKIDVTNDGWGGGFTPIFDDNRTFGASVSTQLRIGAKLYSLESAFTSFTINRREPGTRFDEFFLNIGVPVFQRSRFRWDVLIGLTRTGNLGSQDIQDRVHDFFSVARQDLIYTSPTRNHLNVATRVQYDVPIWQSINVSQVGIYGRGDYLYSSQLLREGDIWLGSYFKNRYADQFMFSLRYKNSIIISDYTRAISASVENGLSLGWSSQIGILSTEFVVNPKTGFSYGSVGLRLQIGAARKAEKNPNASVEVGAMTHDQGIYFKYQFTQEQRFAWEVHHQFWSIPRSNSTASSSSRGHYEQVSMGVAVTLFSIGNAWKVMPYLTPRMGYRWTSTYSSKEALHSSYTLIGQLEGGIRIGLPSCLSIDNTSCGINISSIGSASLHSWTNGQPAEVQQLVTPFTFAFGGYVTTRF